MHFWYSLTNRIYARQFVFVLGVNAVEQFENNSFPGIRGLVRICIVCLLKDLYYTGIPAGPVNFNMVPRNFTVGK